MVVGASKAAYTDNSFTNDIALGARTEILSNPDTIRALFPEGVRTGSFQGISGYINRDGGWAFAAQGINLLMEKVKSLGGQIIPGKMVINLIREEEKTVGVRCGDGTEYHADVVVVASGSWTASTFHALNLGNSCLATG